MTSNHFLLIILYFVSNFFIFIAEASANSDQETKLKFFEDQCQTGCDAGFSACYQKLSTADRNAIMDELVVGKYIQKLQSSSAGTSAYIYGSEKFSVPMSKAKFNEVVSKKCNVIAEAAQAKAAQAVAGASGSKSSSGKSGGGGDSGAGGLVDAAKQMAPVLAATPAGKDVLDAAKKKGKEIYGAVKNAVAGKTPKSDSTAGSGQVAVAKDTSASRVPAASSGQPATPAVREGGGIQAQNGEIGANLGRGTKSEIKTAVEAKQPTSAEVVPPKEAPKVADIDKTVDSKLTNEKMQVAEKESPVQAEAKATTDPSTAKTPDAKAETDKAAADKVAQETQSKLESALAQMESAGGICQSQIASVRESSKKYLVSKQSCGSDAVSADNFCETLRSPKALQVQQLLTAGTAILSKATAASESCGVMGNVSTLANGGMLAAQAVCSGYKFKCDFSCGDAKKEIKIVAELNEAPITQCISGIRQEIYALQEAGQEGRAVMLNDFVNKLLVGQNQMGQLITEETPAVDPKIEQCKKNEIDIMTMGAQAAALLSAAMDSKKCEEQLSSGGSGESGKPIATTAQFCAQAANASSITCRCAANPSGAGCLGALGSGSDVSGFAGLQKNGSNVSGFASVGGPKISGSDIKFDDLPSDIAKKPDDGLTATSPFGTAAAGGGGGGSGGGAGAPTSSGDGSGVGGEEKSKFAMGISSLAKGFGNLFGTNGAKPAAKSLSKQQQEVQLQAIKRKLASDQVRAEISTASGKSNFDKIKARYTETRSSLIAAP